MIAAVVLLGGLGGCSLRGAGSDLPGDALDHAIGGAIGDSATCVVIADAATGKSLYTYGKASNCSRKLPRCDGPDDLSADAALALADKPDDRGASCPSNDDGSRRVGWAEGRVKTKRGHWLYSAVMEGETALPGQEISSRLAQAFRAAGL